MEQNIALPTTDKKYSEKKQMDWECPDFKISGAFTSHMVLQRDTNIRIFGFCNVPGRVVTGFFDGEESKAEVDRNGKWTLDFSPRPACKEGKVLTVNDGEGHEAVLEDILIGDIWMIGGQSNAELNLAPCYNFEPTDDDFNDEVPIRLFAQTQWYVGANQKYCEYPQPDIINPQWQWKRPGRDAAMSFSGMGWYFAKTIREKIDIPLGMIMICPGGACVRELVPEELALALGYDYGANVKHGGYYNALIHPFVGISFKGMLYFQGESESFTKEMAERYAKELAALVEDERRNFGFDFPFYNVQLSDYSTEGNEVFAFLDIIRNQQFDGMKIIPDYTLTVDMDLGSPEGYADWAHSPKKKTLGERLGALALAKEYGIGEVNKVSSPMPVNALAEGNKILIRFENVCDGLVISKGDRVNGFSVGAYEERTLVDAKIISRDTVELSVPFEGKVQWANYAYFKGITEENANLRNSEGMPVVAFSIKVS